MKENHVQYQVSGPPYQAASGNFVPNSAAWEIRKNGFVVGMIFGAVIVLGAIAFTAKRPPGSAPGTPPSQGQAISSTDRPIDLASRKKDSEPFFGIPVLGPQVPGKYAYAIGQDSFLPVKHADGASYPSGTIKDGQFMLTQRRPSDALSLPQDIDDSWHSPSLFSAKLKKPTALQLRDASWWSETRGEYIPWESRDVQPDRYVFDAAHGIAVPVVMLDEAENSVAAGAPLKLFENRLCRFSKSMNGFVPLRHPDDHKALWKESESAYVTASGSKLEVKRVYSLDPQSSNNKETKQ